jgi:hypothetical protein
MVSVPTCVKAEIGERGSEKTDYRNLWRVGRGGRKDEDEGREYNFIFFSKLHYRTDF